MPTARSRALVAVWVGLTLIVLASFFCRVTLVRCALERDEGEYAYAGQLILKGIPPYKGAYNMKLPGTYAAYAAIMAVFGQTPAGIHLGLAAVNAVSIVLVFLIGRKLLDSTTGLVAAVTFALLSTSPSVLGLAAHATHFVTLFALAGTYVLLKGSSIQEGEPQRHRDTETKAEQLTDRKMPGDLADAEAQRMKVEDRRHRPSVPLCLCGSKTPCFLAGLMFGLAFLMKQHGVFFGVFGGLYLLWRWFMAGRTRGRKKPRIHTNKHEFRSAAPASSLNQQSSPIGLSKVLLYCFGFLLPYAVTCLVLWLCGAFAQFWFWTVSYAFTYLKSGSSLFSSDVLRTSLEIVIGPALLLWIAPLGGAIMMWWEELLDANRRAFITLFLVCSVCSVGIGFYYRGHYFIPLLSALALLTGIGVSRSLRLLRKSSPARSNRVRAVPREAQTGERRAIPQGGRATLETFLALPVLGIFGIGVLAAIIGNASLWFGTKPDNAVREIYGSTLFTEARTLGKYLRDHSKSDERIAVIGSEPEIYFYAHRRSATGYLYTYPLMERQAYAAKMQDEMIHEIESKRPEYVVFVDDRFSWLPKEDSSRKILEWWENYWPGQFELVSTTTVEGRKLAEPKPGESASSAGEGVRYGSLLSATQPGHLLLFRRKS